MPSGGRRTMKDTCVVRVDDDNIANFYPYPGRSTAYVLSWPSLLSKKFRGAGVYSIRRVAKSTSRSVRVFLVGDDVDSVAAGVPARFVRPTGYRICSRFLRELGVTPPIEGKRKTLYLVVTKKRDRR